MSIQKLVLHSEERRCAVVGVAGLLISASLYSYASGGDVIRVSIEACTNDKVFVEKLSVDDRKFIVDYPVHTRLAANSVFVHVDSKALPWETIFRKVEGYFRLSSCQGDVCVQVHYTED